MKAKTSKVMRVDQSPMNERRWELELACGHKIWVTARNRPRLLKVMKCPTCTREASA